MIGDNLKNLSKKKYIETAYEIVKQEGMGNVGIRRISKELGVSSTSLYRHFDNLNHLMIYVSLRYLSPYIYEINEMDNNFMASIDGYFESWRLFAQYSFEEPIVYNNIFFKSELYNLTGIFMDYYKLFEEELFNINSDNKKWIVSGNFKLRTLSSLSIATSQMDIPESILDDIAEIHMCIYTSMLSKVLNENYLEPGYVDRFVHYLKSVYDGMVKDYIN